MHQPTDTFPKTGRVTEVCKEWLVREDNALAQHLQTQEINEHYKGNRFRNQVVREDFPAALNAQKQEELTASQQSALYYKMIDEQERADAQVAKELSRKLQREQEQERHKQIEYNEMLARRIQEEVAGSTSTSTRLPINELPIPPKSNQPKLNRSAINFQRMGQEDSQHTSAKPRLNYVSLDLDSSSTNGQRIVRPHQSVQYSQIVPANCSPPAREYINLQSHTPEKQYQRNVSSPQETRYMDDTYREQYELPTNRNLLKISPTKPNQPSFIDPFLPDNTDKIINTADIDPRLLTQLSEFGIQEANSMNDMMCNPHFSYSYQSKTIRNPDQNKKVEYSQVDGQSFALPRRNNSSALTDTNLNSLAIDMITIDPVKTTKRSDPHPDYINFGQGINRAEIHKLSPEKFDYLMGNSGEKSAQTKLNGNTGDIEGAHAVDQSQNDIVDYENTDRIKKMQEFGVPHDEIIEIDRRITQEQRDEELARLLQQEENKTLSFEERDRIVAMEAQDKELARMLQERERAKAKRAKERAKERARLKRMEQEGQQHEDLDNITAVPSTTHSRSQSADADSYTDPIDLLPISKQKSDNYHRQQGSFSSQDNENNHSHDSNLLNTEENYSNPIDLIKSQQNSSAFNSSNDMKNQPSIYRKDDDIYQLPVSELDHNRAVRPTNLDIRGPLNRPSPQRPLVSDGIENIATVIDPTYDHGTNGRKLSTSPSTTPQSTMAALPDFLDQSSSPVPPYMPIQGTRRNTSLENKKKKSKDKCTHQ